MSTTTEENDDDDIEEESARVFTEALVDQVNKSDVLSMMELQTDMLSRYEKTNEMLINFNMLSLARYEATSQEFKQHTQLLYDMKRDLDTIFRRIRTLKQRLGTLYPEAFAACSDVYNILEEEDKTEGVQNCVNGKNSTSTDSDSQKHGNSSQDSSACVANWQQYDEKRTPPEDGEVS